jgi:hypothetical protein
MIRCGRASASLNKGVPQARFGLDPEANGSAPASAFHGHHPSSALLH